MERIVASPLRRRLISISTVLLLAPFLTVNLVVGVAALALIDLGRGRTALPGVRCYLMLLVYLWCQVVAVGWAAAIWLRGGGPEASRRGYQRLQVWWGSTLYRAGTRIYGIHVEVENADAASTGPVIIFGRHVSIADSILPIVLVSARGGVQVRYLLKTMFLWDPCIDLVSNGLGHCFVRPDAGFGAKERARVASILDGMGEDDGVVIFPEGGLVTEAARERLARRLRLRRDEEGLAALAAFRHLLPPRIGGPSVLLRANPGADAVFLVHTGLENAGSPRELWSGALICRRVSVRFERVPFDEIPSKASEQAVWLEGRWRRLDEWISQHVEPSPPGVASDAAVEAGQEQVS